MTSSAYDIANHLDANNIGSFPGEDNWPISVNREAISPDDTISLYDETGGEIILTEEKLREMFLRIRVRSKDYNDGFEKMDEIYVFLNTIVNDEIGSNIYLMVLPSSDISGVGRDANDRYIFESEYKILRGDI